MNPYGRSENKDATFTHPPPSLSLFLCPSVCARARTNDSPPFLLVLLLLLMGVHDETLRGTKERRGTTSTGRTEPGHSLGHCQGTYPGYARARAHTHACKSGPRYFLIASRLGGNPRLAALCPPSVFVARSVRPRRRYSWSMRARDACHCSTSLRRTTAEERWTSRSDGHPGRARNRRLMALRRPRQRTRPWLLSRTATGERRHCYCTRGSTQRQAPQPHAGGTTTGDRRGGCGAEGRGGGAFNVTRPDAAIWGPLEKVADYLESARYVRTENVTACSFQFRFFSHFSRFRLKYMRISRGKREKE